MAVAVLAAWSAMEVGDGYQTHDHLLRAITAEVVTRHYHTKGNLNNMFDASPLSTYDDDRRTPRCTT